MSGPPPSTVNPGQEEAARDACTGVATAFTIVSVLIVSLRTYSRAVIVGNFGKDDWMMLVALIFTIGYLADIYVLRANGMGFSGATLTPDEMVTLIKTTLSIQVIYYVIVFAVKASILFFYLRIAVDRFFERGCKYTIWLLGVFAIVCIICCFTQCVPLHKMWDFTGMVQGHCINTTALFYFTSSFNILTDIWILALPVRTLMKIQRPKREKVALLFVFGLGIFSCIASIVRLHAIRIYTESSDPFYDSVPINLWSMVEVNIGIWCASIPALKALFIRSQRERSQRSTGGAYKWHSREKSGNKITGKTLGGSSSDRSQATTFVPEDVEMKHSFDSSVKHPEQVARKGSGVDYELSGSQERIYLPGADTRV